VNDYVAPPEVPVPSGPPARPSGPTADQMHAWFAFHPADTPEKVAAFEVSRQAFGELLDTLLDVLPEGPDKTTAVRSLHAASMQAHSCLAINGGPRPGSFGVSDRLAEFRPNPLQADGAVIPTRPAIPSDLRSDER